MNKENFNISSPSNTVNSVQGLLSTPKVNRSINNSKSPLGKIKLKKSKRRECTPAYSPNKGEMKEKAGLFGEEGEYIPHTEKKCVEYQKLNFDLVSDKQESKDNPPQKKFLTLIEESLNDVGDTYFGVLGSQTTPDTIFKNIFGEEKEKEWGSGSTNTITNTNNPMNNTLPLEVMQAILNEIKMRNFDILSTMNTRIVCIDPNMNTFDLAYQDFAQLFQDLNYNLSQASLSCHQDSPNYLLFLPGSLSINAPTNSTSVRCIFEVSQKESLHFEVRLAVLEIYLC